jgi:hypothetical protein
MFHASAQPPMIWPGPMMTHDIAVPAISTIDQKSNHQPSGHSFCSPEA